MSTGADEAMVRPGEGDVETPFRRFLSDYCESPLAVIAFFVTVIVLFIAIFSPWISPTDPYDLKKLSILENLLPPGSKNMSGMTFWLGTDAVGRDMLSAIFFGLRTSILVAVSSAVAAQCIGIVVGLSAAYFGGIVDTLIMRLVDIKLGFPTILVALILLSILGPGVDKIIIALIVAQWPWYTRVMRSTALAERNREYIDSARCLALWQARIIFRHLLPNCLPPMIVIGTVQIAHAVAIEATLSFLGLGMPPTEPSLGLLIANGFEFVLSGKYWISFFPGFALLIMIVSINLVGDQVREVLNPRLKH